MIFFQFLEKVNQRYDKQSFELRYGQTIMNYLHSIWPEKYNEITGSNFDCFYDDGKAQILLDKLKKEWPNE